MASPLAEAHIAAQGRLRDVVTRLVERIWRSLPAYDRPNLDQWLSTVLPVVLASQRSSVALTEGYLARVLAREPLGLDAEGLIGAAVRNGTDPAEVYERPFVTMWGALGAGFSFDDAFSGALARATATAAMDIQLSMRATADAVQAADRGIFGYRRAANAGACAFCRRIDGSYVKSGGAMALHPRCGCGLEPLTAPHRGAASLPSGVAVHEHGELGPLLVDPAHKFTTEAALA